MWNAFEIVGEIAEVETIASGPGVKVLPYLRKTYGRGRWRKLKGAALVRQQFSVNESGIDARYVISERAHEGLPCKSLQYNKLQD